MQTPDIAQINIQLAAFMQTDPDTSYDTNISQALTVAEKFQTLGYRFRLKDLCPKNIGDEQWAAIFTDEQGNILRKEDENAATAICRAAYEILQSPKH